MNETTQLIVRAIREYYRRHRRYPKRVTVSREVALELDAALASRPFGPPHLDPPLVSEGDQAFIHGVPIVADLPKGDVIDIRDGSTVSL